MARITKKEFIGIIAILSSASLTVLILRLLDFSLLLVNYCDYGICEYINKTEFDIIVITLVLALSVIGIILAWKDYKKSQSEVQS